jgi:hypothetical protein
VLPPPPLLLPLLLLVVGARQHRPRQQLCRQHRPERVRRLLRSCLHRQQQRPQLQARLLLWLHVLPHQLALLVPPSLPLLLLLCWPSFASSSSC